METDTREPSPFEKDMEMKTYKFEHFDVDVLIWDKIIKCIDKDGNAIMENFVYDAKNKEYLLAI